MITNNLHYLNVLSYIVTIREPLIIFKPIRCGLLLYRSKRRSMRHTRCQRQLTLFFNVHFVVATEENNASPTFSMYRDKFRNMPLNFINPNVRAWRKSALLYATRQIKYCSPNRRVNCKWHFIKKKLTTNNNKLLHSGYKTTCLCIYKNELKISNLNLFTVIAGNVILKHESKIIIPAIHVYYEENVSWQL